MPDAEIILSTWEGVGTEGLDFDELVLSKDPGYIRMENGWTTNVNRQIVSTRNGLSKASRLYAVKIRTDTIITGTGFLDILRVAPERLPEWAIFSERILILDKYTRDPSLFPFLHHPSDIFQFGLTKDLIQLWSPLLTNPDIIQPWSENNPKPFLTPMDDNIFCNKYIDEQYIWLQCCRRQHPEADLGYAWQMRLKQILISESLLTANFKIASSEEIGLQLRDRFLKNDSLLFTSYYKSSDWDRLTALYQSNGNFLRQHFRAFKVILGGWKAILLATIQRLSVR